MIKSLKFGSRDKIESHLHGGIGLGPGIVCLALRLSVNSENIENIVNYGNWLQFISLALRSVIGSLIASV